MNQPLFDPVPRASMRRHRREHRPVPPIPGKRRPVGDGTRSESSEACARFMKNLGGSSRVVFDERTVQSAINTVHPKAGYAAATAMGRIFAGWFPIDDAVRVPTGGKAATAMVKSMLQVGTSRASRHAVPLLETYVGTYYVYSRDDECLRARAGMAIGKVAAYLRERGYPVGVACANVDGTILAVPYFIDSDAPDSR